MPGHRDHDRPASRWETQRVWAASIVAGGLLLFTWPFVRTPRLDLALTYAHFLGAWAAVVAALWGLSRNVGPPGRDGTGGDG
jgi:hypothetical protein